MHREDLARVGSIISPVTLRNLLFLIGGALLFLLPTARQAFAVIVSCNGCTCLSVSAGRLPAFCSASAYCAPENKWILDSATAEFECYGVDPPTVFHEASTQGEIEGQGIYGQSINSVTITGDCPSSWTYSQCDGYQTGGSSGSSACCYD